MLPNTHLTGGLTLHSSPRVQGGLGQYELRRWLRHDVVAKNLLVRRWRCRRCAHCCEENRSSLLVLRPNWCGVVEVLEASRELKGDKDWKGRKRLAGILETSQHGC